MIIGRYRRAAFGHANSGPVRRDIDRCIVCIDAIHEGCRTVSCIEHYRILPIYADNLRGGHISCFRAIRINGLHTNIGITIALNGTHIGCTNNKLTFAIYLYIVCPSIPINKCRITEY